MKKMHWRNAYASQTQTKMMNNRGSFMVNPQKNSLNPPGGFGTCCHRPRHWGSPNTGIVPREGNTALSLSEGTVRGDRHCPLCQYIFCLIVKKTRFSAERKSIYGQGSRNKDPYFQGYLRNSRTGARFSIRSQSGAVTAFLTSGTESFPFTRYDYFPCRGPRNTITGMSP